MKVIAACCVVASLTAAGCSAEAQGAARPTPTWTVQQEQGRRLFSTYCASCHATQPEVVVVGPSMAAVAGRADDRVAGMGASTYLERSIVAPGEYVVDGFQDIMPRTFAETFTDAQREALVAYLMTLK